jgi:hypothetical protein
VWDFGGDTLVNDTFERVYALDARLAVFAYMHMQQVSAPVMSLAGCYRFLASDMCDATCHACCDCCVHYSVSSVAAARQ